MTDDTTWTRKRESFSCTDEVWSAAKTAWLADLDTHPAWTHWLEAALAEATDGTRTAHGELRPAPAKIPTGRREPAPAGSAPKARRSFTCRPDIWAAARDAWWTDRDTHPQFSDWICDAITAKTSTTTRRDQRTPPP